MKIYGIYILSVILPVIMGCATLPDHYISLHNRSTLTFDEILLQIKDEKVLLIGEGHNRVQDHLLQLEIIKYLHEDGKTVAIALEMFPSEMQAVLDQWVKGSTSESDFTKAYYKAWDVSYSYYSDIFEYARNARIPLIGINGKESLINSVAKTGTDKLSEDFRKTVRFTSCAEATGYEMIIRLFEPRLTHMTKLPFFCDAQLLRDTLMAYNIAGILERGGFTVVALVGSAHALRAAVPRVLSQYYDVNCKVIMPGDFAELISGEPDATVADYIWY